MHAGLTTLEAKKRFVEFGPNVIEEKKHASLILQFLRQFKDILVIILIVASIFAYFAGEKIDALIIIGIVFLNSGIGFIQEFKAERAVEALKKILAPKARIIRDDQEQLIETKYLVPGDILILHEGDKVSADCELINENSIAIDESILTGESVPVNKDTVENKKIFMGTQVARGNGRATVTKTGMRTEFGKIALLTSETKKDKSPLQKELLHIGVFVGKVTLGISFILFLIGIFVQGRSVLDTLLFAVSVAVAAVPEGLPTTITVALALGMQRLARKNAIVKQLSSVETLGSTTVICSDKTGTLTKNEMTVQEMIIDGHTIRVHGVGYEPEGNFILNIEGATEPCLFEFEKKNLPDLAYKKPALYKSLDFAFRTAVLCNNARLINTDSTWKILGDPTEGALVTVAEKAGFSAVSICEKYKKIFEIPFDSVRKRMSVIAQEMETGMVTAYIKGAPDSLLELCTHTLRDGEVVALDEKEKALVLKQNELLANRALRTIALAYKELPREIQRKYDQHDIEKNIVFLGIVGIVDPPREDVKEAIKLTYKAGIRVYIITGDHGLTAHAVAKELGLAKSYGVQIITGEMLNKMSDEKLHTLLAPGQEVIFARVSPQHKLRIVDVLKKAGEIVAVTGDGVNDAPALKRADIGIAMGITGTDVSKEAATMVLTDDSFATIVTAIIEGRTIYENMKKFIYYIFSSNIGEVLAVFGGIMLGLPSPLTAIFMLLINTLTDVAPALALGVEPVEKNILDKKPRRPNAKIMERNFIWRYVIAGMWIGLITVGSFLWSLISAGWRFGEPLGTGNTVYREASTVAFAVLALMQVVHAVICRSENNSVFRMKFFGNLYLLGAIMLSAIATVMFVQMPFLNNYLKSVPLTLNQWFVVIGCAFSILVFEEIRKLIRRTKMSHVRS